MSNLELDAEWDERAAKVSALVEKIENEHPHHEWRYLSGLVTCPFCQTEMRYGLLPSRRLYINCPTPFCFSLRAGPLKSKPQPQNEMQGRVL